MRYLVIAVVLVASVSGAAAAPGKDQTSERPERRFALASSPLIARGLSGSLYVAASRYVAFRFNVGAYPHQTNPAAFAAVALIAQEPIDEENHRDGGFFDVGASVLLFQRGLLDGAMIELGVLRRAEATYLHDWRDQVTTRDVTTYAGRMLVGWSWSIRERWFISAALGGAHGYARGAGTTADRNLDHMATAVPYRVSQWESSFECYTRVGFKFGAL